MKKTRYIFNFIIIIPYKYIKKVKLIISYLNSESNHLKLY